MARGRSRAGARAVLWLVVAAIAGELWSSGAAAQGAAGVGSWELLLTNAGIASMHTAITHFGQAVFLDRSDAGLSQINLTSGCVLGDCSAHSVLFNVNVPAVRPLTVLTNPWCSSGQFAPNGTLIQTGGNGNGSMKIRTYTPCPPGGLCDWVEEETQGLLAPRWYATDQLLPDGRVIVVGGLSVFNLEFVPSNGEGLVAFPFLFTNQDSEGDNLYPFVHLLPGGNLWIFCNQASVLYNYTSNTIVQTFPNITGGPRSYPSAGSSVLLPLVAASNYATAEVLVCGGSQLGAFLNSSLRLPALNSCGRLGVTDLAPAWVMETMPINRCMGDMVLLPTQSVLIINGAQAGSQGFDNGFLPALSPVLYQPAAPVGDRFSVLNASTIPRMYHSTANLLPDGRVLVAGSNPNNVYTFTGNATAGEFPTELRVEAFSPPYLSPSFAFLRPSFISVPTAVGYNQAITVVVSLALGSPSPGNIGLCLSSAPFTTHSFSQGQRLLVLESTDPVEIGNNQYQIASLAPINAIVAPPSYYMLFAINEGIPSVGAWVQISV